MKKLIYVGCALVLLFCKGGVDATDIIYKGPNMDQKSFQEVVEHKISPLTNEEKVLAEKLTFKGKTKDGRDITFMLFDGSQNHIDGFESIVNHPDVYPTLRHMGEWWPELIGRTAKRYVEGVRSHIKAIHKDTYKYTSDLDLCWVALVDGKVVARGGLQEEDGDDAQDIKAATEIYYAVHPDYQNQGIATQLAKGAIKYYESLETQSHLRALIMDGNEASRKVLENVEDFEDTGKIITVKRWDNSKYKVFERD